MTHTPSTLAMRKSRKTVMPKILMVLTSHDQLGNTGSKTGFWLEEFAAPYYVFEDAGAAITLASPAGGQPPVDPKSEEPQNQTSATRRFKEDTAAQAALGHTMQLSSVEAGDYDAIFYPGGHGPLWDLAEDTNSISLIETTYASGKPVVTVCHAPGVLRHTRVPDGAPLVRGKSVTGFSDSEEEAAGLTLVVPFLVENSLIENGGDYSKTRNWQPYVIAHKRLITGQNPASSEPAARALLSILSGIDEGGTLASLEEEAAWVFVDQKWSRRAKRVHRSG
jgi:putative intracellular protease/amidase